MVLLKSPISRVMRSISMKVSHPSRLRNNALAHPKSKLLWSRLVAVKNLNRREKLLQTLSFALSRCHFDVPKRLRNRVLCGLRKPILTFHEADFSEVGNPEELDGLKRLQTQFIMSLAMREYDDAFETVIAFDISITNLFRMFL